MNIQDGETLKFCHFMSTFSAGTGPPSPPPTPSCCPCLKWAVSQLRFWTELDYATTTKTNADLVPDAVVDQ